MKIPVLLTELHLDFLPSSKEVGKLPQSDRCDLGIGALGSSLEVWGLDYFCLVVLSPDLVQIAMDVKALRIGDSESFTPPC